MTGKTNEHTVQGGPGAKPPMSQAAPGTTKRIFGYILQYRWRVVIVVL